MHTESKTGIRGCLSGLTLNEMAAKRSMSRSDEGPVSKRSHEDCDIEYICGRWPRQILPESDFNLPGVPTHSRSVISVHDLRASIEEDERFLRLNQSTLESAPCEISAGNELWVDKYAPKVSSSVDGRAVLTIYLI